MQEHPEEAYSRRRLLAAGGLLGAAVAGLTPKGAGADPTHDLSPRSTPPAPPVEGLHLQFGANAGTEMVVSWHALEPVARPRVLLGDRSGRLDRTAAAEPVSYVDHKSGRTVYAHHARLTGLSPDTSYLYAAVHEGAEPAFGTFRTGPARRGRFTFTSFGDQGTPTLGRLQASAAFKDVVKEIWINDNLGSPAAGDVTMGVERLQPLFHLFNGDLCYANLATDRVRSWWDFWENNSRSARLRPWMPSPGNHENELGNGPIGYRAYQTFFRVPDAEGQTDLTRGLWYAFTVGSVRVISLANDDVVYQDAGDTYVRGYSQGAQKAWLEKTLAAAHQDPEVDWIVICMHQVAISTADHSNGADLGVRQEWLPLFDAYGVDLVVCGHEHHYERSHPIHGHDENPTLTPRPAATGLREIDTRQGAVHMVLGGGGTSVPSNRFFFDPPQCRVITAVGPPDPVTGRRPPVYLREPASWSAVRNPGHAYGFASFTVDPGRPGLRDTTIEVSYYDVIGPGGQLRPFEQFILRKPRRA